jgi:hypothetical protein
VIVEVLESRRSAMAESEHREPTTVPDGHLPVTELAAERPGPLSPFGEDVEFPLPPDKVAYVHPSAADRPKLARDPYSWD